MSQARMRKASNAGEVSRVCSAFVKASGDSSVTPNHQQLPRNRSKNKRIPKNIRYDLDNALVGLCDVWFEDIKPHLIRNNIKVHVHGDGSCPASGDHKRVPPGAPGCSHLDPGAASDLHRHECVNYADFCLTPPTASRAPCPRPPAAPPSPASPLQIILQSLNAHPEYKNIDASIKKVNRHGRGAKSSDFVSTDKRSQSRTGNRRRPATAPHGKRDKGSQTYFRYSPNPVVMVDRGTQTLRPARRQTSAVSPSVRVSPGAPAATFDRCPGKTTLVPRLTRRPKSSFESKSYLLSEKRIIPYEEKSKVVEVLFYSPNSSKFSSSVTLFDTPRGKRRRKGSGKIPAWRP